MHKTRNITEMLAFQFSSHRKFLKSPVQHLLRSNNPPTDGEITLVRETIAETEIQLLNIHVTQEEYTSNLYTRYLHSHKFLLSASRRLPTEILGEIFLYFVQEHTDPANNAPPWVLGQICRRWRNVVISIPRLWRALPPLCLGGLQNAQEKNKKMECLTTLLTRSSPDTLSFFLSKHHEGRFPDEEILLLLFGNSERWEQISLEVSVSVCASLNSKIRGRLSSLRSLKLDIARPGNLYVDMFQVAPKLREVYLSGYTLYQEIELPWSQLTRFGEEEMDCNYLARALLSLSWGRIEKLSFKFGKFRTGPLIVIQPTILPRLTTLDIQSFSYGSSQDPGLRQLTLPALEELMFRCSSRNTFLTDFVPLINRSGCDMRRLIINSPRSRGRDVKQILTLTPSLIELVINDPEPELVDDLCSLRTGTEWQWSLVPSLASLTIHLTTTCPDLAPLRRLAEIRCDLPFFNRQAIESKPSPLNSFMIVPFPTIYSYAYPYNEFLGHFDIQSGQLTGKSDSVSPVISTIQKHLEGIASADSDTSILRKDRFELVVRMVDELISLLEHLEATQEKITDLYFTKVVNPLGQTLVIVQIPTYRKIAFSERLETLLSRWSSALNQFSCQLNWGWNVEGNLLYIPENNGSFRKLVHFTFGDYTHGLKT